MINQGEYLRSLRTQMQLRQWELAKLLGTSSDYISMLENDRKRASDNFRMKYYEVTKRKGIEIKLGEIFLNTLRPFETDRLEAISRIL